MTGTVIIEADGSTTSLFDSEPWRDEAVVEIASGMVTVELHVLDVHALKSAKRIGLRFSPQPPIALSPEGIENIKRFIKERKKESDAFIG
jgi:hypothetical protein